MPREPVSRDLPLSVIGVSHRTAPVEVRERMAFGPSEAGRALLELRERIGIREAVLLSTCNRTELYLFPSHSPRTLEHARELLSVRAGKVGVDLSRVFFHRLGDQAVEHLFHVSAGLDSMVTGEAEIQGQVREAYELASGLPLDPPMAGPVLNRLFQTALSVGGQVRAETRIGEGTASVASVAVELARKLFGNLKDRRVLILGAGETAERMVEALARQGVRGILVANRTHDRAVQLAERLHGHAVHMERLHEALPLADIVLSSTAAPYPILTRPIFRQAFPDGPRHPILMIDIGIPRDVDPAMGEEPDVFLYNVDDLRAIVDQHVELRSEALPDAARIIRSRSDDFHTWYASLQVVPVIRRMRSRAEVHRRSELDRLFQGWEDLEDGDRERVEEFSRRLLNKLLHDPTVQLRKGMARGGGADLVDAVRFLYGLEVREEEEEGERSDSGSSRVDIKKGAGE
ncbi:MAG: glutamyl-tRNA reductase [Gemmatimonadales bacterium]|nr:MAG: glutamyl-tRNA reductase [Gemmatimonadales bacterium]